MALISQTTREILPQCSPKENDQISHHIECIALVEVCTRQTIAVVLKVELNVTEVFTWTHKPSIGQYDLGNMTLDNMISDNMTLMI